MFFLQNRHFTAKFSFVLFLIWLLTIACLFCVFSSVVSLHLCFFPRRLKETSPDSTEDSIPDSKLHGFSVFHLFSRCSKCVLQNQHWKPICVVFVFSLWLFCWVFVFQLHCFCCFVMFFWFVFYLFRCFFCFSFVLCILFGSTTSETVLIQVKHQFNHHLHRLILNEIRWNPMKVQTCIRQWPVPPKKLTIIQIVFNMFQRIWTIFQSIRILPSRVLWSHPPDDPRPWGPWSREEAEKTPMVVASREF